MNKKILLKKIVLYTMILNLSVVSVGCTKVGANNTTEKNLKENLTESSKLEIARKSENSVLEKIDNITNNSLEVLKDSYEIGMEKTKETFITVVDFIYYGTEINGYTYDELSEDAKTKCLEMLISFDAEIMKLYPDYKEDFSQVSEAVKETSSSLLDKGINGLNEFIEENLSEETNEKIDNYVEIYNNAIDSGLVTDTYENVKDNIQSWYENIRK